MLTDPGYIAAAAAHQAAQDTYGGDSPEAQVTGQALFDIIKTFIDA